MKITGQQFRVVVSLEVECLQRVINLVSKLESVSFTDQEGTDKDIADLSDCLAELLVYRKLIELNSITTSEDMT